MNKESKIMMASVFAVAILAAVCFVDIFASVHSDADGVYSVGIIDSENGTLYARHGGNIYGEGALIPGLSVGEQIELSAKPDKGYHFVEYSIKAEQSQGLSDNVLTVTSDCEVKAIFESDEPVPETYAVTIGAAEHGTAEASKSEAKLGESVSLKANPDEGYKFAAWELSGMGTTPSLIIGDTLTVCGDCTVTPIFVADGETPFYVTFDIEGNGIAEARMPSVKTDGGTIEIGAVVANGWKFKEWQIVWGDKSVIADKNAAMTNIAIRN